MTRHADTGAWLCAACMAAGSLEKAAELYDAVASPSAHKKNHRAHAAMICACGRAIQALSPKDRRGRLVLLQRALKVSDDIRAAGGEPSMEVLQALAVAAGHAGQVQQALQICREMQVSAVRLAHAPPQTHTPAATSQHGTSIHCMPAVVLVVRDSMPGMPVTLGAFLAGIARCASSPDRCFAEGKENNLLRAASVC